MSIPDDGLGIPEENQRRIFQDRHRSAQMRRVPQLVGSPAQLGHRKARAPVGYAITTGKANANSASPQPFTD